MTRSIAHRGPDGEGFYFGKGVGLGHRRLAIIDLKTGDQPMSHTSSGLVIAFNGEIYNFLSIRAELEKIGHTFRTNSDTEVLLCAWSEWGPHAIDKLDGMFAFAIWDEVNDTLHLVRDRVGKKPLYYSLTKDGLLLFGSELKALMAHPSLDREIDPQAVDDYLAYGYVPDPKCIYKSVKKLPPAHRAEIARESAPKLVCYWKPRFDPDPHITYEEAAEQALWHLDRAVKARLISDVPLGAFLSGGVDSTGVVSSMAEADNASAVKTFSIGFGDPNVDELSVARRHSQRYQTEHFEHIVDPIAPGLFETAIAAYDEPFADSSAMPTLQVCAAAREHVTVALSGDGGDESFAGYRRYTWHLQEERIRRIVPQDLRQMLFGGLGKVYPKLDWAPRVLRFKNTFNELSKSDVGAYFLSISVINESIRRRLSSARFRHDLGGYDPHTVLSGHWNECESEDPLSRALYSDWQMWLAGRMLVKVDRASMAQSLEVRCPLLDHHFLEWSSRVPSDFKIKGTQGKRLLKTALKSRVDPQILYQTKKGFAPPLSNWLRTAMRPVLEDALKGQIMRDSGYFVVEEMDRLLDGHFSRKEDYGPELWSLLVFERFLRRHNGESAT